MAQVQDTQHVSFFGTEFSEVLETKESRKSLLELDIPHTTHTICAMYKTFVKPH